MVGQPHDGPPAFDTDEDDGGEDDDADEAAAVPALSNAGTTPK
ncbi:hypothetical protein [Streptomyces deccanensis]|nr:hypothetical protein [Streptomyces deccanensis]